MATRARSHVWQHGDAPLAQDVVGVRGGGAVGRLRHDLSHRQGAGRACLAGQACRRARAGKPARHEARCSTVARARPAAGGRPCRQHLALQVVCVVLCDHAADGGRDEHIAGHRQQVLGGHDYAAGEGGKAAGTAWVGSGVGQCARVWGARGHVPDSRRLLGCQLGARKAGRRETGDGTTRQLQAEVRSPRQQTAGPKATLRSAHRCACTGGAPVVGRQVGPQLRHLQAVLIGDGAVGVRHRHNAAPLLVQDLRGPGADVAKALRGRNNSLF